MASSAPKRSRKDAPGRRERSFGVTFAVVAAAVAAWLTWRGRQGAAISASVSVGLALLAWGRPLWLKWPSDLWFRLSHALGWFNSRVLLVVMFYLILAPVGLFRRLLGHDSLRRKRGAAGWVPHAPRYRDHKHYERLF